MPYQPYPNVWNNPYVPNGHYQPNYMTAGGTYQMAQQQQPVHGFVYVTGLDGAKAYQMPPNSEMPLFDSTNDGVMFIKTTDGAGFPTITVVDCKRRDDEMEQPAYVTRDELDRVYADLSTQVDQMKGVMYGTVSASPAAGEPDGQQTPKHSADDGR